MFGKIEHIGIAVENLDSAIPQYEALTGSKCYKKETVDSEGVITAFFKMGESKIELLQATNENSAIAKFISKKGEGFHHIAYAVDDILSEMEKARNAGIRVLNEEPKEGADNKIICFLHPKDNNGVLVELCQDK